jgi:glycosyltransferase involved in cell wall biosynthesis
MGEIDENTKLYLLSNCTLLCVPSKDETFGLVYAEAMSYGKAVVALDISPVNEIVENGKTGILVSPDDTDGLQTALDKALNEDSMLKEMGQRGYVRYKDFYSSNRIIEEHKAIYRDLLRP